jgi:hypothetical protein
MCGAVDALPPQKDMAWALVRRSGAGGDGEELPLVPARHATLPHAVVLFALSDGLVARMGGGEVCGVEEEMESEEEGETRWFNRHCMRSKSSRIWLRLVWWALTLLLDHRLPLR